MDTYADDLAEVMESLDLKDAVLVDHSTGGGVVARVVQGHVRWRMWRTWCRVSMSHVIWHCQYLHKNCKKP
jgi:hypothetical protein